MTWHNLDRHRTLSFTIYIYNQLDLNTNTHTLYLSVLSPLARSLPRSNRTKTHGSGNSGGSEPAGPTRRPQARRLRQEGEEVRAGGAAGPRGTQAAQAEGP